MSGFNMAAAGLYGLAPNLYNNQIALNDLTGLNVYPPYAMGMDPMLSMNGSIFGGYPAFGMGMGVPFMPGFTGSGYNYEDYYKNYEKYQDFMIDNQVNYQQKMRNANLRLNGPEEGIAKQAAILHEKIIQNEQEQILLAYNSYKESVRAMYENADEKQIANKAYTTYKQINGCSITEDIRKHGRDSFTQGFLQTLTFGFADGKTAEENISQLTGQPVGRSENAKKMVGNVVGGAVIGGGILASAGLIWKGIKTGAKSKTFWGILAGAAVGTMAALGFIQK